MSQLPDVSPEHPAQTLDSFKVSPGLSEAYEAALQLANELGNVRWLTLLGDSDRGKTHLLVAICRRWLERGKPTRYAHVPFLFKELRQSFDEQGEYYRVFDLLCKVPLLALDDLGVEKRTPWVIEQLEMIVDYRYKNLLPMVVTSNLGMDELSPRIASRLQREDFCRVISINSSEYRLRRNKDA